MAVESGRKIAVGIGKETTRGTTVAPSYWLKHTDVDFVQQAERVFNESGLGVLDKYSSAEIVKDIATGKIGGLVYDRAFGLILSALAGAAPSSVQQGGTGVYDHTYTQSQVNEQLALTIGVKDVTRDERYAMAMLKSLDLNIAVGDFVKFSADFISKKPASASNTVSWIAENTFKAKHVTVKLAANVAGLGAASAIALKTCNLTFDKGVEEYMAVGSNDPNNIFAKELEVKGDFTMLFDAATHRDTYLNNTTQALQITIENTDVIIGSGSASPKLVLTFPNVKLSEWNLDQGLGNMTEQTVGLQALYSLSDTYTWTGVLTNTAASY